MGDTEKPTRQPERADECLAMSTLREKYYRPLVRLAALLTGDADAAEAVACDVLAALRPRPPIDPEPTDDVLRYLQERVLLRSRRTRFQGATATGTRQARRAHPPPVTTCARNPAAPDQPGAADFARLPVVRALQELPRRSREAVVLTHYLDLSEQEAALVAGVTPAALRRFLREALRALDQRFPAA